MTTRIKFSPEQRAEINRIVERRLAQRNRFFARDFSTACNANDALRDEIKRLEDENFVLRAELRSLRFARKWLRWFSGRDRDAFSN